MRHEWYLFPTTLTELCTVCNHACSNADVAADMQSVSIHARLSRGTMNR